MAFGVPKPNVSVVDLTFRLEKNASSVMMGKQPSRSEGTPKGVLGYRDEHMVSIEFVGDTRYLMLTLASGMGLSYSFMKLLLWYDNEWGYSRVLDLIVHIALVTTKQS